MARRQDDLDTSNTARTDTDYDSRSAGIRSEQTVQRQATDVDGNGTAIAALVTGLLAATFGFLVVPALAAILFGIVAIILGAMGMGKANRLGGLHKGLAISGLLSGLLGLLLGVAVVVGGVNLFNQAQEEVQGNDAVQQQIQDLQQQVEQLQGG